jgi:Tfp pilus assembly protein PilF
MSTRFNEVVLIGVAILLVACHSTPRVPDEATPSTAAAAQAHGDVDKRSQKLFTDALGAIEAKHFTDAAALLKELTERDPSLSSAWFNLGMVQSELGDEDAAEASLKRAVEVNPDNCAAYTELGLLRRRAGDFAGAEANYLACVARVPDFREAHLNLGILYELYLGRLPEALDAYRTYLALLDGEDRRVAGWVKDLERRLAVVSQS